MKANYTEFAEKVRKFIRSTAIGGDPDKMQVKYDDQIILQGNMQPEFGDAIYFTTCPPIKIQDSFVIEKIKYEVFFNGVPTVDPTVLTEGVLVVLINNVFIIRAGLRDFYEVEKQIEPNIIFVGSRNNFIKVLLDGMYDWTHSKSCIAQVTLYGATIKQSTIIS